MVKFFIKLFIAGKEPNSSIAISNLQEICSGDLANKCKIQVVDVFEKFEEALQERIVVTPTLIIEIRDPESKKRFFGNLHHKTDIINYLNGKN